MTDFDSTDREEIPVIDPESIVPSAGAPFPKQTERREFPHRAWVTAAALILLVIGIGVFLVLPGVVEERRVGLSDTKNNPVATVESKSSPEQPAQTVANQTESTPFFKQRAEKVLAEMLRQQSILGAHGVDLWGGGEYLKALENASEGDKQFAKRSYEPALHAYVNALIIMNALAASIPERLTQALDEGSQALVQSDRSRAQQNFTLALAIDADNENAKRGLTRAETLDELLALISAGEQHERQNQLDDAQSAFQQAVKLDTHAQQALDALKRVTGKITERNYQRALARGFAALTRNQYKTARREFTEASNIRPGTREVKDGLAQAEEAIRLNRIAEHREKAIVLEMQERWREAAEHYKAALSVDPNIQFARDGNSRSQALAQLYDGFDRFLEQPSRLASEEPMRYARELIARTSNFESKGPKLAEKIARLEKLIEHAKTPIKVLLQSDNQTEVLVYKVGRFGKFATHELMLRPGNYTVVGHRDGFRDVRQHIAVVAGQSIPPIVVRCEEPI